MRIRRRSKWLKRTEYAYKPPGFRYGTIRTQQSDLGNTKQEIIADRYRSLTRQRNTIRAQCGEHACLRFTNVIDPARCDDFFIEFRDPRKGCLFITIANG